MAAYRAFCFEVTVIDSKAVERRKQKLAALNYVRPCQCRWIRRKKHADQREKGWRARMKGKDERKGWKERMKGREKQRRTRVQKQQGMPLMPGLWTVFIPKELRIRVMTESGYFAIIIRISLADGAGFGSSRGSFSWEPAYCERQKLWAATSAVRDAENK